MAMEIILVIATLLGGVAAIWFFWDQFVKALKRLLTRGDEQPDTPSGDDAGEVIVKLKKKMPELLAEMKQDLAGDDSGAVREFFISSKASISPWSTRERFVYYEDKHDHLRNKIDLLENYGLVTDVTIGNMPIYRMSEELVEWLLKS